MREPRVKQLVQGSRRGELIFWVRASSLGSNVGLSRKSFHPRVIFIGAGSACAFSGRLVTVNLGFHVAMADRRQLTGDDVPKLCQQTSTQKLAKNVKL